ncbi:hypothetical protein [uncultured Endozoicomonas sp.]|uniref:hypothetical protein n=1 Tax=uncultured Endozoicomonas sp. TaxID=432652 RepID=UPI002608F9ED|nr:hypothetical protein [uncultured Endozoicomonas sp.]
MKLLSVTLRVCSLVLAALCFNVAASHQDPLLISEIDASRQLAGNIIVGADTDTTVENEEEVLQKLAQEILVAVRDQNYTKMASYYTAEALADFKYSFLVGSKSRLLRRALPDSVDQLKNLAPLDFMSTVMRQVVVKLIADFGMPMSILHPEIIRVEIWNEGKEGMVTYSDMSSAINKLETVVEETEGYVKIGGQWHPLVYFFSDIIEEMLNLIILTESFG